MAENGRPRQEALVIVGAIVIAAGVWAFAEKAGLVPSAVWVWWQTMWAARSAIALVVIGALLIVAASRDAGPHVPSAGTRLYRSRHDRWVSGVLGGLAQYFSVDPTLVRLAFLAFAVFVNGGGAVIAYLVMALVVPEEPEQGAGQLA
ncbi:PspC domain-containing protein [Coriobacteriia bacterium Es71-Z0120]|uniref:PspC domain-containing protein n=1 Tax=Parvivirga hydrogeniphila TaxID=2939460 RepID=UPI002260C7F9|nr:PspC domain-containing protein [Parvivirga hydrogeniphila]MCL4078223.1 PspC domain-containing protein [Parvivirga hydrogeniphila]